MTDSVYVIQKSSGDLYCVTRKHYEEYKYWYDLTEIMRDESDPVEETVGVLPEAEIVIVAEVPVSKNRGRKAKTKE